MTTLRRILMATAQEQPVVADPEPKKKHARRRFDEEKELQFEHSRNGYKRKRKDMSNGSGNDRNHRDKDKSQPKRKIERSPSEKESAEKSKSKLKKKPAQAAQKVSKAEVKNVSNGVVDRKKKKKKAPEVPDPPKAPVVVKPVKVKKPDPPKVKPPPVKKEKEKEKGKAKTKDKVKEKVKEKAKEREKKEKVKVKIKEKEKEVRKDPPAPKPKVKVDVVKKAEVVEKAEVVTKAEVVEKKDAPVVVKKAMPPSTAAKTKVVNVEKEKVKKTTPPPPAPAAPVEKKPAEAKPKSVAKEVKQETTKPKPSVKKADLKQGKADTLEPPPPPAEKPSAVKEPVKKSKEKENVKAVAPKEEKPRLKIEIPKPAPPERKETEAKPDDVPMKKGSTEVIPKPEVKSAEKKRKRDEEKTPKEKASAATTPAAHRPPKRVASMKCPGVNPAESAAESKGASRGGKNGTHEENKDWVQCERCKVWFVLPSTINPATLPDHWYCEMKTWGSKNTKCCPPDKDTKRASKPAHVQSNGKKRNRATAEKTARSGHNQRRVKNVQSSRPRINNIMSNGSAAEGPSKTNPRGSWKWVMCETCNQWRKVPPEVDLDKLPEKWYCSMNKWDPSRASCSAPQEADETQAQSVKTVSSKKFVTLPDGVNMYGGQIWPVQKKQSPMNYRELIVNHYRNFKQWEIASSKVLNERYDGTSLFIPRDVVRVKNSKSGNRKTLAANPKSNCISRSAAVEDSVFSKLFPKIEAAASGRVESVAPTAVDKDLQVLLRSRVNEPGLLKVTKPWKRVKWDWSKGSFTNLGKFPVEDST